MRRFPGTCALGIVLLAVVLTRIPQLFFPGTILDYDECVVALMAQHLRDGRWPGFFFPGQRYGFSFIETVAGAVGFVLFPYSDTALKVAMLTLFVAAVAILFVTARRLSGVREAAIACGILAFSPAWFAWSMKARGGYLTAFLFTQGVLFLLVLMPDGRRSTVRLAWAGIGVFTGIIYWAQPFWLAGLAPFLLHQWWRRPDRLWVVLFGVVGYALVSIPLMAVSLTSYIWHSPDFVGQAGLLDRIARVPEYVLSALSGAHVMGAQFTGSFTRLASRLWGAILLCFLLVQPIRLLYRRHLPVSHLAATSCVLIISGSLVFTPDYFRPRYLLPLSEFFAIGLAAELGALLRAGVVRPIVVSGALCGMALLGTRSLFEFRRLQHMEPHSTDGSFDEREAMNTLVAKLDELGIRHVYSALDGTHWQILFYGREVIAARGRDPYDRWPQVPAKVDQAFDTGELTALVGTRRQSLKVRKYLTKAGKLSSWKIVAGRYYVAVFPPRELLKNVGFRFRRRGRSGGGRSG